MDLPQAAQSPDGLGDCLTIVDAAAHDGLIEISFSIRNYEAKNHKAIAAIATSAPCFVRAAVMD